MKTTNLKATCVATLLALSLSTPYAMAEVKPIGNAEGWLLGLGMVGEESPYKDVDDSDINLFPYIAYEWENAHLGIDGFNYNFYETGLLSITADLQPRWSFTDPDDSPLFNQIERDTALEAGLSMQLKLGFGYIEASSLHDISGEHDGYEATIEVGVSEDLGWAEAGISVGANYRDESLATHLYGVKADEASSTLAAYEVEADWQPYLQAELVMPLTPRTMLAGFVQYQELDRSTRRSPLVDSDHSSNVGLLLIRQF